MHRKALIYRPAKTAMQSGAANTQRWVLEFITDDRKFVDPLMGWIGSRDTTRQLRLSFNSQEEAIAYAQQHRIAFELRAPQQRTIKPKSYAANFAYHRRKYSDLASAPSPLSSE